MSNQFIFIFPGQASQYTGMGRDLYTCSIAAQSVMERVAAMDGLSHLPALCFEGPENLLTRTDNVQPAITAVSLMALAALREACDRAGRKINPLACAGHSLGEYAAHAAAGNLTEAQAMTLVARRGYFMNQASQSPNPRGGMLAVLGISVSELQMIVARVGAERIAIANINCPGQVILSGAESAIAEAGRLAEERGAKRCIRLKVSGAWHSPLTKPAKESMASVLTREIITERVKFNETPVVVANATAEIVRDAEQLRRTLTEQITAPVNWMKCVGRLLDYAKSLDATQPNNPIFVEIGPGKVLKGLMRGIDRELEVLNVEDMSGVQALVEKLH